MEYQASYDNLVKGVIIGVVLLFAFIGQVSIRAIMAAPHDKTVLLIHGSTILFFILTFIVCYLYSPQKYVLENDGLTIKRMAQDMTIKYTDIAETRAVEDIEIKGSIRTFGVGGLFGYYGKFYHTKLGKMTWYTTQRKNRILISTKEGKSIVITPDDLSLLEDLKAKLKS